MKLRATTFVGSLLLIACGGSKPAEPPPIAPVQAPVPEQEPAEEKKDEPEAKPEEPKKPEAALRWTEGFATPESVLVDVANDRYLVSNINGKPAEADNNGYISELSPDGKVTKQKLISAGGKVKLDAPKGMGIHMATLYVSDITVVRKFDVRTGAPKGEIAIEGATFLNDIAVAPDGRVFVSDSGLKPDFSSSGTDAVYVIDKTGKPKAVAKAKELNGPNGLWSTDKGLLVVTFGTNELYRLDDKGAKVDVTSLPAGSLDGIAAAGDSILISSWKASAIFKGKLGDKFEVALSGLEAPADFGYDAKRKRVLVPRFNGHTVEAYDLK